MQRPEIQQRPTKQRAESDVESSDNMGSDEGTGIHSTGCDRLDAFLNSFRHDISYLNQLPGFQQDHREIPTFLLRAVEPTPPKINDIAEIVAVPKHKVSTTKSSSDLSAATPIRIWETDQSEGTILFDPSTQRLDEFDPPMRPWHSGWRFLVEWQRLVSGFLLACTPTILFALFDIADQTIGFGLGLIRYVGMALFGRLRGYGTAVLGDRLRNAFDWRRPVLLLRAHVDDHALMPKGNGWKERAFRTPLGGERQHVPFEEAVAVAVMKYGPLVGLRTARQSTRYFQFKMHLVDVGVWQRQILYWIRSSQFIVLFVGTPRSMCDFRYGLGWEISTLVSMNCPQKILLVMPPVKDPEAQERWAQYRSLINQIKPGTLDQSAELPSTTRMAVIDDEWNHHWIQ